MRRWIIVVFLSLLWAPAAFGDQERDDWSRAEGPVHTQFPIGDFVALEKLAANFRAEKARSQSGLWLSSVFYRSFVDWYMADRVGGLGNGVLESQMQLWIKTIPDSPTANLAYAELLYRIALAKRGWSPKPTPDEVLDFKSYLGKARVQLDGSRKYAGIDPHWYDLALRIAKEQSWPDEEYDALANEAVNAAPYFYEIYFAMMERAAYQGPDAIERVVRLGVSRTQEKDGDSFRARGYWYASDRFFGSSLFDQSAANWKTLKPAFDELLARYPGDWNANAYARLACLAGDVATGKRLIGALKGGVETYGWQYREMLEACAS